MSVTALVGGQFGSEGKGLVAAHIADRFGIHVRTGAPNAGHTYYLKSGEKVVARSVPCGAINPKALLFVGAGGLVDIDLLKEEVAHLDSLGLDVSSRLWVDEMATVVDKNLHHHFEGGVEGEAHRRIGSTGEGVGPARMARMSRGTIDLPWLGANLARDCDLGGIQTGDTAQMINTHCDRGERVLLEGTQGSGLSLTHGPWPYVTSSDANAAQLASDAGISPRLISSVILVLRTYPIRVAGESGPLAHETTWEELGFPAERTTVTKKIRRVAEFSVETARRAIMLNRPTEIALTFCDYVWPELSGRGGAVSTDTISPEVGAWLERMELALGTPISMLGTGPRSVLACWGLSSGPAGVYSGPAGVCPVGAWPTHQEAYHGGGS